MRVLLKISFLGTAYHGWQVQPNGITVQEVMQNALESLYKTRPNLSGCSRTDAGVHANEFFCHYDIDKEIPTKGIVCSLNTLLPNDIVILSAEYVKPDFHSRYSAKGKNYIYKIHNSDTKSPFNSDRMLYIDRELNIDLMNEFCKRIIGRHDFIGFSSSGRTVTDTVRIITGTAISVSDGKIDPFKTEEILLSKDRNLAGFTAPAHGLYLNKVIY